MTDRKQRMMDERQVMSPHERTDVLFNLGYRKLAERMTGMTLALAGRSTRKIYIEEVEPFSREENQHPRYSNLLDARPGQMTVQKWSWKKGKPTNLFLITAKERGKPGALIRIKTAYFLRTDGEWEKFKNGIEMGKYLDVRPGDSLRLGFRDNSDTLFLFRSAGVIFDHNDVRQREKDFGDLLAGR